MKRIGTITIGDKAYSLDEGQYHNGRIALAIDEGMWGKLTVNVMEAPPPPPGCIHVKMWEENERLRAPAMATGLFENTGERVPCGFVQAEVWKYRRAP